MRDKLLLIRLKLWHRLDQLSRLLGADSMRVRHGYALVVNEALDRVAADPRYQREVAVLRRRKGDG